ncbi:MAG TPA: glycosyltransferase [Chitinispirillaceae bacterium]|nr:glycosyltransferase [Chitinispirillaceae bacterium]
MKKELKLSVVVASHRPQMICGLLDALQNQNLRKDFYETIVVCDYHYQNLVNRYSNVQWFFVDDHSISAKRNIGAANARADILAFTDDDCIPERNWISEGLNYLQVHKNCSAVEGFTSMEKNTHSIGMYREAKRLEEPSMRTNNIFYRKEAFQKVGGFDQRFTVQREDADLAFSVLEKGGQIDYCANIRVEHRFRHWEYWDLLKNCWNRRFDPLLFKKHPGLYRKYIGSPFTPSIIFQLFAFAVYGVALKLKVHKKWIFIFHFLLTGVLGLRRSGISHLFHPRFIAEIISVVISPFVVIAALVNGFIRFRKV